MYSDSAFLTIFVPENLPHVFTLLAKEAPGAAGAAGSPPDGPRAAPPGRRGRGRDGAHTKRQMGKQSSVFNPGLRKRRLLFVFIYAFIIVIIIVISMWSPQHKRDLECVQRRAGKMIQGMECISMRTD